MPTFQVLAPLRAKFSLELEIPGIPISKRLFYTCQWLKLLPDTGLGYRCPLLTLHSWGWAGLHSILPPAIGRAAAGAVPLLCKTQQQNLCKTSPNSPKWSPLLLLGLMNRPTPDFRQQNKNHAARRLTRCPHGGSVFSVLAPHHPHPWVTLSLWAGCVMAAQSFSLSSGPP